MCLNKMYVCNANVILFFLCYFIKFNLKCTLGEANG